MCCSCDVVKTSKLLELSQGDWEGKTRSKIYTPKILSLMNKRNWDFSAPNGESQRDVEKRMLKWMNKAIVSKYPGRE